MIGPESTVFFRRVFELTPSVRIDLILLELVYRLLKLQVVDTTA